MGREQFNAWITSFKQLVAPDTVDALGRDQGLCQRRRQITPWRLAVSLLSAFTLRSLESLADLQREYNALFATALAYKPFHKQLAKASFADFMRELAGQLLDHLRVQVLQPCADGALNALDRVLIQDGSSFALRDDLADIYPGRFNQYKPAAVELQTTLDLFAGVPSQITLTPDTAPERDYGPAPEALSGALLLADRGYFKWADLNRLNQNAACFVMRAYATINPRLVGAFDGTGQRRPWLEGRSLSNAKHAPGWRLDLDVVRPQRYPSDVMRLIVVKRSGHRSPLILVTNLDRSRYDADTVLRLYQLRWQVELLFKEYKSHAGLHAFRTANPYIAEGLVWAAVAAATLQRFMAHLTPRVHGRDISSQRTAKAASIAWTDVFKAIVADRSERIRRAFKAALAYLATNAPRAHPWRDRQTGRLQTELETTGVAA